MTPIFGKQLDFVSSVLDAKRQPVDAGIDAEEALADQSHIGCAILQGRNANTRQLCDSVFQFLHHFDAPDRGTCTESSVRVHRNGCRLLASLRLLARRLAVGSTFPARNLKRCRVTRDLILQLVDEIGGYFRGGHIPPSSG